LATSAYNKIKRYKELKNTIGGFQLRDFWQDLLGFLYRDYNQVSWAEFYNAVAIVDASFRYAIAQGGIFEPNSLMQVYVLNRGLILQRLYDMWELQNIAKRLHTPNGEDQ